MLVKWNLPVGRHDDVTWKHRTDILIGGHGNVIHRHGRDLPLRLHWVFYLGFALDLVIRYLLDVATTFLCDIVEIYQWNALVKFHRNIAACFIWDVPATLLGRKERRCYDVVTTSSCRVGSYILTLNLKYQLQLGTKN